MKNAIVALAVIASALVGAEASAQADDPSGTWSSAINFNNRPLESTISLRLDSEGSYLSGFEIVQAVGWQEPIANPSFQDGKISFRTIHDFGGVKVSIKYSGTLEGDTITGKANIEHGDRTQSSNWIAQRSQPIR